MTDITEARKYAVEARRLAGAHSPTGRRLSILIEQMENGAPTSQTLAELDQIRRDGGRYIHANHGAGSHSKGGM